jgi:hypothetical protein
MFRHLHPTDSPRLLAFKQAVGRAEVFTLSHAIQGAARPFSAVRYAGIALSPRAWESCWVFSENHRIKAVLRAGPRSGPLAWEVRDLFVHRHHINESGEVLESLSIPAAKSGARRIFLRLLQDSPLYDQARHAGYMPAGSETLYRARSGKEALVRLGGPGAVSLRMRSPEDDEALFRLYCSSAPIEFRISRGQTVAEWLDATEKLGASVRHQVLEETPGKLSASIQTAELSSGRYFSATWSREFSNDAAGLVGAALAGTRDGAAAVTLVPAHNEMQRALLEDAGFEAVQTYDVMAKMLAAPVMETHRAVAAVG